MLLNHSHFTDAYLQRIDRVAIYIRGFTPKSTGSTGKCSSVCKILREQTKFYTHELINSFFSHPYTKIEQTKIRGHRKSGNKRFSTYNNSIIAINEIRFPHSVFVNKTAGVENFYPSCSFFRCFRQTDYYGTKTVSIT
jgi:hypothetical protein